MIYICTEKTFIGRHFKQESTQRFWAAGTSLVGVYERGLLSEYIENGVNDIKLILPNPDFNRVSYEQLAKYDQLGFTLDNQVELAIKAHRVFVSDLDRFNSRSTYKQYGGIMYAKYYHI